MSYRRVREGDGSAHRYFKYFVGLVILAKVLGSVTNGGVAVVGYTLTLESAELIVVKRWTQSVVNFESSWLGSKNFHTVKE